MAIERKFVAQNLKEFRIKEFVETSLSRVGLSSIKLQRTPLGDKIIVRASRPGLVVGRGGSNIQRLTQELKDNFDLENPQIEIEEIESIGLDSSVIAEMIVNSLERFGSGRFKGVGHRALQDVMNAGALGVEILISGKIPSSRAKTWRFYQGYLKKCGDVAVSGVDVSYKTAILKTGAVGVKVSILPPTTILPDKIELHEATIEEVEMPEEKAEEKKPAKEEPKAKPSEEKPAAKETEKTDKKSESKTTKKTAKKTEPAEEKTETIEKKKEAAKAEEKPAAKETEKTTTKEEKKTEKAAEEKSESKETEKADKEKTANTK